jgi:putative membrane protein
VCCLPRRRRISGTSVHRDKPSIGAKAPAAPSPAGPVHIERKIVMRTKRFVVAALATGLCVALAGVGLGQQKDKGRDDKRTVVSDKDFINEVASGGMAEVKMGQLAADRGGSADVRKFGQRMVDDHSAANKDFLGLLQKKGMTAPKEMTRKQQELYDRLSKLRGAEFDKAYIAAMVEDHKEDVAHFEAVSRDGSDPDLKAWASKTLPTLKEHLKMAQDIQTKLSK